MLEAERQLLLDSLPGWTWSPLDSQEQSKFDALNSYIRREGHANVPASHLEGGVQLGQWIANARGRRRKGNIDPGLESRLSSVSGFKWEPLESQIPKNVEILEEYLKANPDVHSLRNMTYRGKKLNSIVVYLRKHFKADELPNEFVERLNALPNWSWSPFDDLWQAGYSHLVTYVKREGTSLVPQTHIENDLRLGTWVNAQRVAYRKGSLDENSITLLEALPGWTWKPRRGPQQRPR